MLFVKMHPATLATGGVGGDVVVTEREAPRVPSVRVPFDYRHRAIVANVQFSTVTFAQS